MILPPSCSIICLPAAMQTEEAAGEVAGTAGDDGDLVLEIKLRHKGHLCKKRVGVLERLTISPEPEPVKVSRAALSRRDQLAARATE